MNPTVMATHPPKLIEDPQGMLFEYVDQDEAEFLYEVRGACMLPEARRVGIEGKI